MLRLVDKPQEGRRLEDRHLEGTNQVDTLLDVAQHYGDMHQMVAQFQEDKYQEDMCLAVAWFREDKRLAVAQFQVDKRLAVAQFQEDTCLAVAQFREDKCLAVAQFLEEKYQEEELFQEDKHLVDMYQVVVLFLVEMFQAVDLEDNNLVGTRLVDKHQAEVVLEGVDKDSFLFVKNSVSSVLIYEFEMLSHTNFKKYQIYLKKVFTYVVHCFAIQLCRVPQCHMSFSVLSFKIFYLLLISIFKVCRVFCRLRTFFEGFRIFDCSFTR